MIIKEHSFADIATPTGAMRLHVLEPAAPGRYPGLLLYSEIYQITAPVRRMAAYLAGHGFVVAAPEVYHEFEAAGTVLAYDKAGTDRGNDLKFTKETAAHDSDASRARFPRRPSELHRPARRDRHLPWRPSRLARRVAARRAGDRVFLCHRHPQ
jgi:dienelactone hydrolase